jgi:(p)ppGpp synthase/HD superfamily hydrolase
VPQTAKAYSSTLYDAIELAARAHHGQVRKGTEIPYLVHPLAVAGILITAGCPEPLVIAGLLHDTLEDTPTTPEDIRSRFGGEVADLVEGLSEPDKTAAWEVRKAHTLAHLEHRATEEMLLISLADKLDNIRALRVAISKVGDEVWGRFNRPRAKQAGYYEGLAAVFSRRVTADPGRALAGEFAAEVRRVFGCGGDEYKAGS